MDRRTFLGTLASGLLAAPLAADAQPAGKVYRVGYLLLGTPVPSVVASMRAFREDLAKLGYVEGQNVRSEERWAEGHLERLPVLAEELVRSRVDVIIAGGTPHALAARGATTRIPIVGVGLSTPVEVGLVASFSKPGGNVTGVTGDVGPEEAQKNLQLLSEIAQTRDIAVILNPAYSGFEIYWQPNLEAASKLGLKLHRIEVRSPEEMDRAFASIRQLNRAALAVGLDPGLATTQGKRIVAFAAKHRRPALYSGPLGKALVERGGLISHGVNHSLMWRQAAPFVAKILGGADPATLPVEQPTTFEVVINLKTAKALGLTIPQSLLQRADQVIE